MNRVLSFLTPPCPCAAATETLAGIKIECELIEAAAEGCVEFCIPSVSGYIDGNRSVRLFLTAEPDETDLADDLREFAIVQLRGIARELAAAAERLEGQVSP